MAIPEKTKTVSGKITPKQLKDLKEALDYYRTSINGYIVMAVELVIDSYKTGKHIIPRMKIQYPPPDEGPKEDQ